VWQMEFGSASGKLPRRLPASHLHRVWGNSRSPSQRLTIFESLILVRTIPPTCLYRFVGG
jgi:hypothetical protein